MNLYAKLISFTVMKLIPEVKPTEMNPLIHIKLLFCFNGWRLAIQMILFDYMIFSGMLGLYLSLQQNAVITSRAF